MNHESGGVTRYSSRSGSREPGTSPASRRACCERAPTGRPPARRFLRRGPRPGDRPSTAPLRHPMTSHARRGQCPGRLRVPFLEPLQNPLLLGVLGRSLGGLDAGGSVSLLVFGELVASLGIRLVPLALLYAAAPAVYAHAFTSLSRTNGSGAEHTRRLSFASFLSYPAGRSANLAPAKAPGRPIAPLPGARPRRTGARPAGAGAGHPPGKAARAPRRRRGCWRPGRRTTPRASRRSV